MAGEFHQYKVSEFAEVVGGGTPKTTVNKYWKGSIPWLTPKDLSNHQGRFVSKGARSISHEGLQNSSARILPKGTVLLTSRAPVGYVAIAKNEICTNQGFRNLVVKDDFSPEFIYYLLVHNVDYLKQHASGSTFQELSGSTLKNLTFKIPTLPEQRAIAYILGVLDDKIELNRRMNETLETMAQTIFKSWFVDFDPVVWKATRAGNPVPERFADTAKRYQSGEHCPVPSHIADLFPDAFEESELGEIPKGWTSTSLFKTAEYVNGAAFRNEHFCPPGTGRPVIKIAELKNGISSQTKYSQRNLDTNQRVDTGDLLYSWSGSPDTSLDVFIWTGGPGLLNQHIFKVVTGSEAQKRFVYYLLKNLRPLLVETARNKQTTGLGHVTVEDMKRIHVYIPQDSVRDSFDSVAGPLFERCFRNNLQTAILAQLRDTLLPKLISGELRVPDTE